MKAAYTSHGRLGVSAPLDRDLTEGAGQGMTVTAVTTGARLFLRTMICRRAGKASEASSRRESIRRCSIRRQNRS